MGEQAWVDEDVEHGQILVVTDNPISRALTQLAEVVGRPCRLLPDESALADLQASELTAEDAVVLCDHDTPDARALLELALEGPTGYVAMLGNRQRAQATYRDLAHGYDAETLARLHVPAGLNLGGKSPGEIALSVFAEIVAVGHRRPGGPMRV